MSVRRQFDPQAIDRILENPPWNDDVVAALLSVAGPPKRTAVKQAVLRSLAASSRPLRREAIQSLSQIRGEEERLLAIAMQPLREIDDRADAIAYLPRQTLVDGGLELLQSAHPAVVVQTLRALRDVADQAPVLEAVAALAQRHSELDAAIREELNQWPRAGAAVDRPADWEQWKPALAAGGDAEAGRRAFFSERAQCSRCHQRNGRGGGVGPNLSGIGAGHTPEQLLRSVLYPSESIAPEYASHPILTSDGQLHSGIQFHYRSGGSKISILTMEGNELTFDLDDVETFRANPQSMMPEDLVNQLSVGEIRDLIAMLSASLAH
jgi:putative heme-binding domain-containing protein